MNKQKEYHKEYYSRPEVKERTKKYRSLPEVRAKKQKYDNERYKNDIKLREHKKNNTKLWIKTPKGRALHNLGNKNNRKNNKIICISIYSNETMSCKCCNEKILDFLTIDHINGGGRRHKKQIKTDLYVWLIRNNFPEGFQVLCMNCNWGKYVNGGICPHKEIQNEQK